MAKFVFLDTDTKKDIENWIDRVIGQIRVEMHNTGINASGNLSKSLEGRVVNEDEIEIIADNYFLYAEKGRDKGKIPTNFADILQKWLNDKGIQTPSNFKNQRSFAFAIANKIRFYGSDRYRNPSKRVNLLGDVISRELPNLNDIIGNRVVLYVNDNLFN